MLLKGYLGFNTQHKFRFYVKPFLKKQSFNCLLPSYIVIECISCCCCSAAKSCLMLCNPMNYSMPGFPVLHYLPELAQTQCPLSRWCHPTISSSVIPFSCPQSFPASRSFPMSQLFASGGRSIGVSASASVLPMNSELLSFRINWFDFLAVQETLKSLLQHQGSKASILGCWTSLMVQLSHPYMTAGKTIALTIQTFVGKVMSLLFNMLKWSGSGG